MSEKEELKKEAKAPTSEFWKPTAPGDSLFGEIIQTRKNPFENSKEFPELYVVKDKDTGKVYTLSVNKLLYSGLIEEGASVGDTVYIEYQGDIKTKFGRSAKNFKIAVKKKTQTVRPAEETPKTTPEISSTVDKLFALFPNGVDIAVFRTYLNKASPGASAEDVIKSLGLKTDGKMVWK